MSSGVAAGGGLVYPSPAAGTWQGRMTSGTLVNGICVCVWYVCMCGTCVYVWYVCMCVYVWYVCMCMVCVYVWYVCYVCICMVCVYMYGMCVCMVCMYMYVMLLWYMYGMFIYVFMYGMCVCVSAEGQQEANGHEEAEGQQEDEGHTEAADVEIAACCEGRPEGALTKRREERKVLDKERTGKTAQTFEPSSKK